jgi:heme a synthase
MTAQAAVFSPAAPHADASDRVAIARWLYVMCALVFAMVVVGGVTRLTESGLSITHWSPVSGVLPPLTDAQWQAEFEAYQKIPEYQQINKGFGLDGFKQIYWWEYWHRNLGRLIGVAFAVPLLWFWLRNRIPTGYKGPLLGLFALGGLQGFIGWWMVSSGLVLRTDVSHYRLATHLGLALFIFAAMLWTARSLVEAPGTRAQNAMRGWSAALLALIAAQITLGAFVAGLDARFAFNTWPLMGESLIPDAMPWSLDDGVTVQFLHRKLAFVVLAVAVFIGLRARRSGDALTKRYGTAVMHALTLQIVLGIWALLHPEPLTPSGLHQAGSLLVLGAAVLLAHRQWKAQ